VDPLKVLVVEDDTSLHPVYSQIVQLAGAVADFALDGRAASKLAREHSYACMLVDKNLPDADGLDVAAEAKKSSPRTEILIVTGYAGLDTAMACVQLGAFDYVVKPFAPNDLVHRLRCALTRYRSGHELHRRESRRESELERRAAMLVQADRLATLGTMAGCVGHELNNITTALIGTVQSLRESAESSKVPTSDSLDDLDRIVEHLRIHGSQLLSLGRPGPEHEERFDFRAVVAHTLTLLRNGGRTKYIDVRTKMPAHPLWVTVNRTRMEQILINLVGNAADALESIEAPQIALAAWQDLPRGRVFCRVDDNGCGIPPALAARVFEAYFTTKGPGRGTGLGLPVVRQIVESYGGMLQLHSRAAGGTTAVFDVPEAKWATLPPTGPVPRL